MTETGVCGELALDDESHAGVNPPDISSPESMDRMASSPGLLPSPVSDVQVWKPRHIQPRRYTLWDKAVEPALHLQYSTKKSRVETQIKLRLTLEPLPAGITRLHLPYYTIGKAKLLAQERDRCKSADTLELHTSLVRASAMQNEEFRLRACRRAAVRGMRSGLQREEHPTDTGGEVRICQVCKLRERRRSSRKIRVEGDNQMWPQAEDERVIIFNDTEYKEWRLPRHDSFEEPGTAFGWRPGTMQVELPMRIACYCRHHGEKIGFWYVDWLFSLRTPAEPAQLV
ncbi:SPT3 Dosage dependent suppressor of Ty-induced promoter mutations-like protein [Diplodia intermedia]|uniref:SPT3 Dosage dependent suppressor of Ty-induced promoter mutations-like protein n=1 Tax=Diplodia intermedia TaxID=856260 RepID=A0ABR3TR36_9PEZI